MNSDVNWKDLREERRLFVERIRALPFDLAWHEVRAALEASPSLYAEKRALTVYEGPTRSFLQPLAYELLQDFTRRRGIHAADWLFARAGDAHPLVAAYCLHALSELDDARLPEAVGRVAKRSERIHAVFGSFGWEGTLSEYGRKLHQQYAETLEQNRNA